MRPGLAAGRIKDVTREFRSLQRAPGHQARAAAVDRGNDSPHTALSGGRAAHAAHRPYPGRRLCRRRRRSSRYDHRHCRGRPVARTPGGHRGPSEGPDSLRDFGSGHLVRGAARFLRVAAATGVRRRTAHAAHLQRGPPVPWRAGRRRSAADGVRVGCDHHGAGLYDRPGSRRHCGHHRTFRHRADRRGGLHIRGRTLPDVVQPSHPQC